MELVLQQKQALNLVMTTELYQAINLLQYSTYDLYQYIQKQKEENPLLELIEDHRPSYAHSFRGQGGQQGEEVDPLSFISDDRRSLYDFLLEQVNLLEVSEAERPLLEELLYYIDDNGYLQLEGIALEEDLGLSREEIEAAIYRIQGLEPIGVGARTLSECLSLQARRRFPEDGLLLELIEQHLEDLAAGAWEGLALKFGVTPAAIQDKLQLIQSLNPEPGASFAGGRVDYIEPDIIISQKEEDFVVQLNDAYLPQLRLAPDYLPYLKKNCELSAYVKEQYKKIYWLRKGIEQRRQTILKIMRVIIERQLHFFEKGFKRLQPLTLKEVAEEIDMHESTVSRATANKLIQTPKGTFDLRRLFSTRIHQSRGPNVSQTKVKLLLQEIIEGEDKARPLSDQKISDYFKDKKSIEVSRRTVTKYRKQLNIPNSRERKFSGRLKN